VPLDGVDHRHARYSISVTATYRGAAAGQPAAGSIAGSAAGAAPTTTTTTAATPLPGSVRN
jgi:hypothetical protein